MCRVMGAVPSFDQSIYLPLHPYFLKVLMLPVITERAQSTE